MKDEEELSRKDEWKDELSKKREGTRRSQIETICTKPERGITPAFPMVEQWLEGKV